LIDFDDFVDVLNAQEHAVGAGRLHGAIQLLGQGAVKDVVNERGFAGTRNTGHHREQP